jgi:prevent-host-death family protein
VRNIIPITDLQQKTKKYVDRVRATGVPLVITQRGRAAAVLSSAEDFEGLLITLDEMTYPDWKTRLRRALRESQEGKGIELETYLRKEKKRKRRAQAS